MQARCFWKRRPSKRSDRPSGLLKPMKVPKSMRHPSSQQGHQMSWCQFGDEWRHHWWQPSVPVKFNGTYRWRWWRGSHSASRWHFAGIPKTGDAGFYRVWQGWKTLYWVIPNVRIGSTDNFYNNLVFSWLFWVLFRTPTFTVGVWILWM